MIFPTEDQILDVCGAITRLEKHNVANVHCCDRCAGLFRKSATAHGREAVSVSATPGNDCYFCYGDATQYYQVAIPGYLYL